jgi:hypothetical protein
LWKEAGIATKAPNHQSAQKIFCAILCFSVFVAKKGSVPLRLEKVKVRTAVQID